MKSKSFHLSLRLIAAAFLGACGAEQSASQAGDAAQQVASPVGPSQVADARPAASEARADARKNVILISLDTCRTDSLGFHGSKHKTPALDSLAEESIVFEDCLAQSGVTGPSHMSILTGHYVQRHGLQDNGQSGNPSYTLASLLRGAGYRTAAFTGHGSFQAKFGHGIGFEHFVSTSNGAQEHARNLDQTIPEAMAWLDDFGERGPFFLLVHGYDPHLPYWPAEPLRSEFAAGYEGGMRAKKLKNKYKVHDFIKEHGLDEEDKRYMRAMYDAEIIQADALLGRFFKDLERRGLMQTSVLVFTSDHGELLGEHGQFGHGKFYQEVVHVPLMLRFPGQSWKGRSAAPVEHVDLVPTLLSYLEMELPAGLQGYDLLPLATGGAPIPEDRMRIGQHNGQRTLRAANDPNLKVMFRVKDGRTLGIEAFDLGTDPTEQINLFDAPIPTDSGGRRRITGLPKGGRGSEATALVKRYMEWSKANRDQDELYRSELEDVSQEDVEMLEALGYMESPDED